jgi:2-haloacid dehalogenase
MTSGERTAGHGVKALMFDVFGTITDWRGTLIREGRELEARRKLTVDWAQFAEAWRAAYAPSMRRVNEGDLPWKDIDALHRLILDDLLPRFGINDMEERDKEHLNRVWHRLDLWPDVRSGLARLRPRFLLAPLSNGNVSLLVDLARHAGLHWDCLFSAELVKRYKPDPAPYLYAAELLDLRPEQVMMVAAHNADLDAARSTGFRTAFVRRRSEYGPGQTSDLAPPSGVDISASDLNDLAAQLIR